MSYLFEKTQVEAADSPSLDAFGRWRSSNPVTLFDGRVNHGEAAQWSNVLVSGTLAYTHNHDQAMVTLTSTANTAGRRLRQSLKRFNYTPGKSQLILMTFVMGAGVGGNKKKVGQFDDYNGIFFQQDGSEASFNIRTYTSGSAVDTKTVQADWNLDTFDGTGPSGITLDLSKTQILVIDYEWLGVGRVRIGFNIDGVTYYCHQILNANNNTLVYMTTANLPLRYEMEHSGTGGASEMGCICCTVISEGGSEILGVPGGRATGLQTGLTAGTAYAMILMRLQAAHGKHGPIIQIVGVDVLGTTNNDSFEWLIVRDPDLLTGTPTYDAIPNSAMELEIGGSGFTVNMTNADIISMGIGISQSDIVIPFADQIQLESTADDVAIPFAVVIKPYSSMTAAAAVRWRQYG